MIVEVHVTINGSKAAVWAATTDIAHFAQLLSGVEKIEILERPVTGLVELKWKETRILFGKSTTVEKWITEATENEFYITRAEDGGFVFLTTNRISGSDGSVTLTGIHETQPQGFAARLKSLQMVFFKGVIKKAILQDLNDIKAVVEQGNALSKAALRPFEIEAIRLLAEGFLSEQQLNSVFSTRELFSYTFTGVGYFLSVKDPSLPHARTLLSLPCVAGAFGNYEGTFIVFLETNVLTLEFQGHMDIPVDFRERDVVVSTQPINIIDLSAP